MEMVQFNQLARAKMAEHLTRCCGASGWVNGMLERAPFRSADQLFGAADEVWWGLSESDWLEAFRHHPKIGDVENLRHRFANTADLSAREQAGVSEANEAVLERLAQGNRAYEEKFGYIFIVCATGKSAAEMSDLLEARLPNRPAAEIRIAAEEQRKITQIRLRQLII